jgi:hypothetical protein
MQKELDNLMYQNKILAKKLKEFKILELNQNYMVGEINDIEKIKDRISMISEKIEHENRKCE